MEKEKVEDNEVEVEGKEKDENVECKWKELKEEEKGRRSRWKWSRKSREKLKEEIEYISNCLNGDIFSRNGIMLKEFDFFL